MKSKSRYYLLTARNGGMIAESWEQAQVCSKYFRGNPWCKGYNNYEEVQDALYLHISEVAPLECEIPAVFPVGKVITIKALCKAWDKE